MAGFGVAVYIDEMFPPAIAVELRKRGYDVVSCHKVARGNRRISDRDQLQYAAEAGRAILTQNIQDYVPLDIRWKRNDRTHAGIILYPHLFEFGDMLRRVAAHLDTTAPEAQHDTLLWLS